jgi:hypothetical protein
MNHPWSAEAYEMARMKARRKASAKAAHAKEAARQHKARKQHRHG